MTMIMMLYRVQQLMQRPFSCALYLVRKQPHQQCMKCLRTAINPNGHQFMSRNIQQRRRAHNSCYRTLNCTQWRGDCNDSVDSVLRRYNRFFQRNTKLQRRTIRRRQVRDFMTGSTKNKAILMLEASTQPNTLLLPTTKLEEEYRQVEHTADATNDAKQWYQSGKQFLSSPEFRMYLESNEDPCANISMLDKPLAHLLRLCQDCVQRKQSSELIQYFLKEISMLLGLFSNKAVSGKREHFNTTPKSHYKQQQQQKSHKTTRLAARVHSTICTLTDQHQCWKPETTDAFQILIRLAAAANDPHQAQIWLERQWQACRTSKVAAPTRHEYTIVVQSLQQSKKKSAETVSKLMRHWLQLYNHSRQDPTLCPTEAAYTSWILSIARENPKTYKNPRDAALEATRVLAEMWDAGGKAHNFYPSAIVYNTVLHAWAVAGAPEEAEAVLREQCERASNHRLCLPDTTSFTTVLAAWSKSNSRDAPMRAEQLFKLMQSFAERTNQAKPNVVTYTTLLNCWAKSNHINAPSFAEEILQKMLDGAVHDSSVRPNIISYNLVLNAWARSRHRAAVDRVDYWYKRLCDDGLEPDHITYMTRINVWERSGHPPKISAQKVASILGEMVSSTSKITPLTLHYNRVILAWTQCGDAFEAELLLERMLHNFLHQDRPDSAPNLSSFNFVLSAWSRQSSVDAARHCEEWLDRMEEYGASLHGMQQIRPDVVSFNTVLGAWARSNVPDVALDRALSLRQRMRDRRIRPSMYTFGALLQILVQNVKKNQSTTNQSDMSKHVLEILKEMKDARLHPNSFMIHLLDHFNTGFTSTG